LIHEFDYGWSTELREYYDANVQYMEEQIDAHADKDPFLEQVSLLLTQQKGMYDGYVRSAPAGTYFTLPYTL
jgi:hypothetical protein